jgi:hypothetical protein
MSVTYDTDEFASDVDWMQRNAFNYERETMRVAMTDNYNVCVEYQRGDGSVGLMCHLYTNVRGTAKEINELMETCAGMLSIALGYDVGVCKTKVGRV